MDNKMPYTISAVHCMAATLCLYFSQFILQRLILSKEIRMLQKTQMMNATMTSLVLCTNVNSQACTSAI